MKHLLAAVLAAAIALPALADEECTDDRAEALSEELFAMVGEEPARAEKMDTYIKEVEADYGGEPPADKTCEAIRKLMAKIRAGE